MGPSFRLITIAGIQLRVHWTFFLLVAWFLIAPAMKGEHAAGEAVSAGLRSAGFILAVFACVVLHEFGHAFAARAFGIRTRDVTLLPIGGIARLEKMPEKPSQELIVALAGPAVNLVIAGILIPVVLAIDGASVFARPEKMELHRVHFLATLATVNVSLVVFNLIPAFPMDGGRVLRAVLAMVMDRVGATRIAAGVGQVIAVGFALLGLFGGNVFLMLIALFVFLGAAAEAQATQAAAALKDVRVADAMVRRFRVLRDSDTLQTAADELLAGEQQDFPVLRAGAESDDAGSLVGVLTRNALLRALAAGPGQRGEGGLSARVGTVMGPALPPASPDQLVTAALETARQSAGRDGAGWRESPLVCVAAPDASGRPRLVGMITQENLTEIVLLRAAVLGAR